MIKSELYVYGLLYRKINVIPAFTGRMNKEVEDMKKKQFVSLVLAVSMLMPLAGCYSDKKGVTEAVDNYMNAVISLDFDEVADLMEDSDGIEEVFAPYETALRRNKKYEDVFATIAESITYEIDSKSIESSTKDQEASCDVTIFMVDYDDIYEEVEKNDGDIDDYLDALEDAGEDQIIDIHISFDLVMDRDKWVIKDKKLKNINKIFKFFGEVYEYGLIGIRDISEDEFVAALKKAFDLGEADIYRFDWGDSEQAGTYLLNSNISYISYDDPDDAIWDLELYLGDAEDMFSDSDLVSWEINGDEGYLLINGAYYEGFYVYGGCYVKSNMVIMAIVYEYDAKQVAMLDEFLDELDLPKP